MNERSEAQYKWIQTHTDRLSEWLDARISRPFATNTARVLIITLFVMIALAGLSLLGVSDSALDPLGLILKNIGPEMAGIVIGVVVIDYLNERRQTEQLKQQLIRQMGLNIRDVAVAAARELEFRGWLRDGSLSGVGLWGADLSGARLSGVNLSRVYLTEADLSGANLSRANLSGAHLTGADLSGAYLSKVNLSGAALSRTDLSGANLSGADLSGARLVGANLSKAFLWGVQGVNWTDLILNHDQLTATITDRRWFRWQRLDSIEDHES